MRNSVKQKAAYKKYRQTEKGNLARRKAIQKYRKNHKDIIYCGHIISHLVERNKIEPPTSCSMCGNEVKVEGHHPDYSLPLEVMWLCNRCHNKIHNK